MQPHRRSARAAVEAECNRAAAGILRGEALSLGVGHGVINVEDVGARRAVVFQQRHHAGLNDIMDIDSAQGDVARFLLGLFLFPRVFGLLLGVLFLRGFGGLLFVGLRIGLSGGSGFVGGKGRDGESEQRSQEKSAQ